MINDFINKNIFWEHCWSVPTEEIKEDFGKPWQGCLTLWFHPMLHSPGRQCSKETDAGACTQCHLMSLVLVLMKTFNTELYTIIMRQQVCWDCIMTRFLLLPNSSFFSSLPQATVLRTLPNLVPVCWPPSQSRLPGKHNLKHWQVQDNRHSHGILNLSPTGHLAVRILIVRRRRVAVTWWVREKYDGVLVIHWDASWYFFAYLDDKWTNTTVVLKKGIKIRSPEANK